MKLTNRIAAAIGLSLTVASAFAADPGTPNQAEPAYFSFISTAPATRLAQEFVFELTDPRMIEKARKIINGHEKSEVHVMGVIKKGRADYNELWPFYLVPNSIDFFSYATEVCDARPAYVEEHLEQVGVGGFLPNSRWCPWTSKLVREVKNGKFHSEVLP